MSTDLTTELIADTFDLLKQFETTTRAEERERIALLIQDRSERLPTLQSWVVQAMDGEALCACLDEDQARKVQRALMLAPVGVMTRIVEEQSPLIDFIHPESPVEHVVFTLID